MNSRTRVSSISPSKITKKQIKKYYYPSPNHKQFMAYSIVQKQSSSGFVSNQRLLLLDTFSKSLRYYSKIPQPLPHPQLPLPQPKQVIFYKKCLNFSFKNSKNGIGKVLVKYMNLNGDSKPHQWHITFNNKKIMQEWVIMVNQAQKQQHKNPQKRPISVSRQPPKIDQSKYMTPFIQQTGGFSQRRQTIQQNNSFVRSRLNTNSLQPFLNQKQKQMQQNHRLIHNISQNSPQQQPSKISTEQNMMNSQISKQKYQTPMQPNTQNTYQNTTIQSQTFSNPSKNSSKLSTALEGPAHLSTTQSYTTVKRFQPLSLTNYNFSPTTFSIPQVDNQSKASNLSESQKKQKKATNFYINRLPPDPILEIQADQAQQSRLQISKVQKLKQIPKEDKQIKNKQYTPVINQYSQFSKNIEKVNFNRKVEQIQKPEIPLLQAPLQSESEWINSKKFYPYLYQQFMNKCLQNASFLVQNLSFLLKSAKNAPNTTLYLLQKQSLTQCHIIQHNIHFTLSLPKSSIQSSIYQDSINPQYFQSLTKMKQYSSMVGYINRISTNNIPHLKINIQNIIPIPYCILQYGLFWIKCKAVIGNQYKRITQSQGQNIIDDFFKIPKGSWDYYFYHDTLLVDYTLDKIKIDSQPTDKQLIDISQSLCRQQVIINHSKDLLLYCTYRFNLTINSEQILKIYKKCVIFNPNSPVCLTLLSILFSIYTYNNILQQLPIINSTIELLEHITQIITNICFNKNSLYFNKLYKQFIQQLQQYNINTNINIDNINKLYIFASLLDLFSIQAYGKNKKQQNIQIHNLHKARFKQKMYMLWIQNLCVQMNKVQQILRLSLNENWNQQKIYQRYQTMKQQLQKFQYKWNQCDTKRRTMTIADYNSISSQSKRRNTLFSPKTKIKQIQRNNSNIAVMLPMYSNLHTRIYYHHSLYTAYNPSYLSSATIPQTVYSHQVQSIIKQSPPTYYSYLIGINCIKWVSKVGLAGYQIVNHMIQEQIQRCRKWVSQDGIALFGYYQLAAAYYEQRFNINKAIYYARLSLQLSNNLYGNLSIQAAEHWFMLANIISQDQDLYLQSVQSYEQCLQILQQNPPQTKALTESLLISQSRSNIHKNINSYILSSTTAIQAQLKIRLKILKLRLAMNNIELCIEQCALCFQLCQALEEVYLDNQLQIYSILIRCLQLTHQQHKLTSIIDTLCLRFHKILQNPSTSTLQSIQNNNYNNKYNEQHYRQQILKLCLNAYVRYHLHDPLQRQQLYTLCRNIRDKYQYRYTKKQYHNYITNNNNTHSNKGKYQDRSQSRNNQIQVPKFKQKQRQRQRQVSILQWIVNIMKHFYTVGYLSIQKGNNNSNRNNSIINQIQDLQYTLYDNQMLNRIQPITQNKQLIPTMRAIQAVCGIIGYTYLQSTLSQ